MKKNSKKRFETWKRLFAVLLACAMLFTNVTGTITASESLEPSGLTQEQDSEAQEPAAEESVAEDAAAEETPAQEPAQEETSEDGQTVEDPSAAESEQTFDSEAKTEETEQTFEETTPMPETSFEAYSNKVFVKVYAPEGAFPEGTTMKLTPVASDEVMDAVENAVEGTVEKVHAVDITFYNVDGTPIEPQTAINVSMSAYGITDDDAVVVHVPDEGEAEVIDECIVEKDGVTFESDQFSIYAIVETGVDARLSVVFHRADGTETTQMINERQIPQIDQYIFDPGANEPEGSIFKGWTTNENYDSSTEALTVAQVREAVAAKLQEGEGVSDGDTLDFYAMAFDAYEVTYLDEKGILVQAYQVLVRTDAADQTVKHDVTLNYTPYPTDEEGVSAEFIGWQQLSPEVTGEMVLYKPGDSFTFAEGVKAYTLKAYTQKGHWLSFDENLSGASYTEPQFIAIGAKPVTPSNPTRVGYTFDGWYTEDASSERDGQVAGDTFNFNNELTKNTTVYAKWNKATTASYSVVIWKQNVDGEHYDYAETVTVNNATVDSNTYAVTASGSGVSINTGSGNTNKSYQFFHLRESNGIDAAKPVAAEGNTVINVYFDRDTITYNFRYSNSNTQTFSGLYGSAFTQWPDPGNGYVWHRSSGSGYYATHISFPLPLTEFNPTAAAITDSEQNNTEFTFTLADYDQGYTLRVYKQTTSGTWSFTTNDLIATAPLGEGGTWYPTETYTGFKLNAYCTGTATVNSRWTNITPDGQINYRSNLNLRYTREQYDIIYNDGIFVDGSGNPVDAVEREDIARENGVFYEADISSKNITPEYDGFVFLGWYDNENCVGEPYPFTTMPAHNVTLYAKWGLNEFEINLHGNDSTEDPIQYNSSSQAEKFYLNTGEKIGNVGGERIYCDLVGWYTDPEFKHAFDFDAIVVNKTNVQKYGEIYSAEKIDPSYPTVIGRLDLYAKWRGKLVGSDGIVIQYVDGEHGTGATEKDENKYVDGSFANARGAFAAADPETYVFSHWEVQTWNGSAYVDAGIKVFPGETFEVKSTDAKIVGEDGKVYTLEEAAKIFKENKNAKFSYTVQVKAVYIEKDKELETYIKWYYNYEGAPDDGLYQQSNGLKINQACDVPKAPTRKGYTFLGWIRGVEETEASTTSADHVTSLETPYINYKDGAYDVTKVAPDEMLVNDNAEIGTGEAYKYHHAMYAKWEENEVTIKYAVASDSTDMGTVDPAEETLKAATGTAAGSTATASSDMYIIDYWTVDDGTEHVGDAAKFVPSKNSGLYEEHTYYAHFKLNKAEVTVHHYLKGTTTKVAEDVISNEDIGSEYTAAAATKFLETYSGKTLTDESYSPSQKITVEAEGNEIIVYYTLPLKITAKTDSKTYDGEPLNGEYTITGALAADEAAIKAAVGTAPSITDAGEKKYLTKEDQAKITGIPEYYAVTYEEGTLTVNKRSVTLTSATDSKVYDGKALTNNEVTVSGDGFVKGEGATYDVTGSQTEVGGEEGNNTFTYTLNEGTKAENYDITKVEGTLTVTALTDEVTVTITEHSGSEKYDGSEKTVTGYDVEISNPLYTKDDFTFSGKAEVKGTDAGTYEMQLKPEDFTNINKNFSNVKFVIVDGKLEITPRPVILTSGDAEKVYDGTPLTNKEVKAQGFVGGDGATYDVTGSQTEVGGEKGNNTFTYTLNDGTKADNYTIQTVEGTLTVKPVTNKVTVTITENSGSEKYDGSEKTVTGYTVSIDNELYTEDDFTFKGDATVKGTDAGTYEMQLKPEDFTNISKNFSNVEFVIVDGKLTISKRTVTLTSADDEKVYDGTELKNDNITVGGDRFAEGEGATYNVTGSQTEVGGEKGNNTFTYTLNDGTKADNYEITTTEGTLTVTPVTDKVVVTITGHKADVTYNGKEQSVDGYDVKISNELYKETDFAFNGNNTVSAKNANDEPYMMGLKEADFENTSKNFTNVTFKVTDGQLKINKLAITIETGSDEKAYDGKELVKYDDLKVTVTEDEKYEGTDPEKNEYSFTLSTGDKLTVTITGTQTYVGSSDNTCGYAFEAGKESAAEPAYKKSALLKNAAVKLNDAKEAVNEGNVDNNYDVTVIPGTLTVTDDVDPSDVVTKKHDGEDIKFNTGDVVTFTITVTNIYDEDKDITLEEMEGVELAKSEFKGVKPGETVTTTATYTIIEADVLAGFFKNTVIAKFNDIDKPYPGEDEVPTVDPNPSIHVFKTTTSTPADGKAYKLGETIEYTIQVANDGNVTLTDIVATDELTGDEWKIEKLASGESKEFTAKHVVTEEDVRNGKVVNVATATGNGPTDKDPDVIPGTTEDPTEESKSHITIEKTITNKPANGKAYRDGETIEYKIVATNDGNQTMKDITVKDELTGDEWKIETLAPGESKEFTAKYTVTKDDAKKGSVVNTATGEGTSENPDDKPEVTPGTAEAKTETTPDPTPVPKTGDKTSMGLWVSMMAAALAGFGGTLIKRKKEEA